MRQRLVSMPIIPSGMNRSSFLHEVHICHELNDNSSNETVEGRKYCVSFLPSDGSVDANGKFFIGGSVMNELICHNKMKNKCVYDKIVIFSKICGVYQMFVIN